LFYSARVAVTFPSGKYHRPAHCTVYQIIPLGNIREYPLKPFGDKAAERSKIAHPYLPQCHLTSSLGVTHLEFCDEPDTTKAGVFRLSECEEILTLYTLFVLTDRCTEGQTDRHPAIKINISDCITRELVRAGPSFQLGIYIDNTHKMVARYGLLFCCCYVDLFIARTDTRQTRLTTTSQPK